MKPKSKKVRCAQALKGINSCRIKFAKVAELVYALDLGSSSARSGGSSPPFRTQALPVCLCIEGFKKDNKSRNC